MPRAQLSLEYIIILAAFFSFLLMLLPSLNRLYHTGLFSTDIRNAESFLESFRSNANALGVFGDGSEKLVTANVLTRWRIKAEGGEIIVTVNSDSLGESKTLSRTLDSQVKLNPIEASGRIELRLKKEGGLILAKHG